MLNLFRTLSPHLRFLHRIPLAEKLLVPLRHHFDFVDLWIDDSPRETSIIHLRRFHFVPRVSASHLPTDSTPPSSFPAADLRTARRPECTESRPPLRTRRMFPRGLLARFGRFDGRRASARWDNRSGSPCSQEEYRDLAPRRR